MSNEEKQTKVKKEKKKKKWWQILLIVLAWILGIVIVLAVAVLGFLSATEYKPEPKESMKITGTASNSVKPNQTLTVLTWNTGFQALSDNADFFMDGGTMVQPSSEERVKQNIADMTKELQDLTPDVIFLQEVDVNSKRSYHINATEEFAKGMPGYQSTFANNFKVSYDPYPIPPMGKIDSGIQTLSAYPLTSAERIALPNPFSWPIRMGNLKRCLLVSRTPIEGTDKELVLVNLHLEAYDDGEGKAAQTKMLREFLANETAKGNYVIAGGDFNQVFEGYGDAFPQRDDTWAPGTISAKDFSGFQLVTDGSVPTCRSLDRVLAGDTSSDFQYYVIDGFIVSNNITVEQVATQDLKFHSTDHNPVLLTATLK